MDDTVPQGREQGLRLASGAGRRVLLVAVLGSGMAALDATVVNVALPTIGRDLHAGLAGLQWILDGYLLTLAALILVGGSLGDRYGRRRVFLVGVVWFALASLACGLAPNIPVLVAARALQGVGGALLTPGSLAIIQASFRPADRGRAIGAWSGLGGLATAVGPFAGGWLVEALSWRYIFLLNLPLAALVLAVAARHVPETTDPTITGRVDVAGALLGAVGLAGVTFALVEGPRGGVPLGLTLLASGLAVAALAGFVVVEGRGRHPMLPLGIFSSRQFTGANLVTFAVYGALGGILFLLVVFLQTGLGYSPVAAGASLLPVTALMLVLSPRAGALAQRTGPRLPMTVGPLVAATGMALMTRIRPGSHYVTAVLPAVVVFGLGLAATVAPLTATVLAAADARHAGVASGVNNAVARVAGLLAVATVPLLAGIGGDDYRHPAALTAGFHTAATITAGLAAVGGVLAWLTIRDQPVGLPPPEGAGALLTTGGHEAHCALDAPPLRTRVGR